MTVAYDAREGRVVAVDGASLVIDEGAFVCIVGPSGCGKTTLLQVLAGFRAPTRGTVTLRGRPVTAPGADRGVVFQQPALFPWMTVAGNAGFGLLLRGTSQAERDAAVERALRQAGLWEFRRRYPYELSGGMQQRLAIVRALANDPDVVLMDEPFGALDALTREQMQVELHALWARTAKTIVFITHDVEEAVYLGTDIVVMSPRPGRIVASIAAPFARTDGADVRAVKSSADFIALRERVLALIRGSEDAG